MNRTGSLPAGQPTGYDGQRIANGTGRHAANGVEAYSWFASPPRPITGEPRPAQPAEPAAHPAPPPGGPRCAETPHHGDRLRLAQSLRETAVGVGRLADQLSDRQARLEQMVVDLAEVTAAITACCLLLEVDAASYNPRAQRRMVQATGYADALTSQLAGVFSALQQRYAPHDNTPA